MVWLNPRSSRFVYETKPANEAYSLLQPGDLVGVNKDSYLILETLPPEYDSRVKAMEVDEKPTEDYSEVGGLDKQIQVCSCSKFC